MFSRQKQMNDMPGYPDNSWPSPKVDLNESLNSDSETQSNEISRLLNNLDYHIENDQWELRLAKQLEEKTNDFVIDLVNEDKFVINDLSETKEEKNDLEQQKLCLARDKYNHLNNVLSTLNASGTSFSSINLSTKYDPNLLLKSDVIHASERVMELKCELERIGEQMLCPHLRVETFSNVEHKSLSKYNRCNVVQAQAIVAEQPSNFGQIGLERSLEKSKENGAQIHCCPVTDDPDLQKQSLSSAQISNKLSTASQTDLFGEKNIGQNFFKHPPMGSAIKNSKNLDEEIRDKFEKLVNFILSIKKTN